MGPCSVEVAADYTLCRKHWSTALATDSCAPDYVDGAWAGVLCSRQACFRSVPLRPLECVNSALGNLLRFSYFHDDKHQSYCHHSSNEAKCEAHESNRRSV